MIFFTLSPTENNLWLDKSNSNLLAVALNNSGGCKMISTVDAIVQEAIFGLERAAGAHLVVVKTTLC
jgi:hypothetical protein